MSPTHLSDEAVAAFADGVLRGHARDRAARHTAGCPECARAVAVQREAVCALRAAPAPPLPSGLLDRLRTVPSCTPIQPPPDAFTRDGRGMFSAFGVVAALLPPQGGAPAAAAQTATAGPFEFDGPGIADGPAAVALGGTNGLAEEALGDTNGLAAGVVGANGGGLGVDGDAPEHEVQRRARLARRLWPF